MDQPKNNPITVKVDSMLLEKYQGQLRYFYAKIDASEAGRQFKHYTTISEATNTIRNEQGSKNFVEYTSCPAYLLP